MQQHTTATTYPADRLNGLKSPHLIVGMHDRDQYGLFCDEALYGRRVDHAEPVDRDIADLIAKGLQIAAYLEDGRVLHLGCDYMFALLPKGVGDTFEDHIV